MKYLCPQSTAKNCTAQYMNCLGKSVGFSIFRLICIPGINLLFKVVTNYQHIINLMIKHSNSSTNNAHAVRTLVVYCGSWYANQRIHSNNRSPRNFGLYKCMLGHVARLILYCPCVIYIAMQK